MAQPTAQAPSPFELLARLEAEARAAAPGLPEQVAVPEVWSGLGFRVGEHRLVVPLGEVSEVVPPTPVTPVPLTQRWLKGVANVRGDLLVVTDLADFLGLPPAAADDRARFLIVNQPALKSAVLVAEVLGMRHFTEEETLRRPGEVDGRLGDFLAGAFQQGATRWAWLDLVRLVKSESFLNAAA